ncbi:very-long-chain (3R)-3-hydroxyacyl-CoA dehydratase PASTICCINO 2B-like [Hordeum vulgare subsp. vulgare]|uniref:Very-long-chain (3R)-3-hydroxyacyl-CoA dehydratase n=1 Tax=Hordeum vulgare subsp. vulgare TaxID=112509 RepID=A0A287K5N8_HORVV|nr:very-long-chain (3R)-3-hydroxyacyl-CoA dehydratase PASTICCINO 2B-like [Hordeum vulgare subsp. vulgare]
MATAASGSALRRLYLSAYNWVVFFGWAQVLCYAASALLESGHEAVYAAVERPLQFAQTAAFMEILHSILGFVRSPISTTIPQISGRLYITWGILWGFREAQPHIFVTSLIISWSITEIIRYSFFGMKETFGFAPYWLLWLRYSTFLVFYPIGMLSEVGLIFVAIPSMKTSSKSRLMMPNKWNFSFDYRYELALTAALYVSGFPYLFRYMVAKRKKVLSVKKTA